MRKWNSKMRTTFLCMMLMVTMALCMAGCSSNNSNGDVAEVENTNSVGESKVTVLGEGATVFAFAVVDKDGTESVFEIHTDKEIVGEALLELELIAGEMGSYGLYVKSVNGITADYDTDGTYWAFYVNGEYASSGVDTTAIKEGESYMFKVEK